MQTALLVSSFVLGLAGGSHCMAMCGPACIAINAGRSPTQTPSPAASAQEHALQFQPKPRSGWRSLGLSGNFWGFMASRSLSYALLGAVVAGSIQALAWGSGMASAIKPLWAVWHALVLVWGAILLLWGRQPLWAQAKAQALWQRIQAAPWAQRGGLLGLFWGLLPCGLLYSAFLQASLTGHILAGALAMLLFSLGSGLWLLASPMLWHRLQRLREGWGQRLAGLLLIGGAIFAIWLQFQPGGIYCEI